ncbi:hypothetical protein M9434_001330 [Picochlorum sp. BPE23]|nr:hypothetical protein M9434_001330 [Picochlorum sp. BPE23]KAI8110054.1 hypothetical protein M9435_001734 [Picochlorum sp. BPE23]
MSLKLHRPTSVEKTSHQVAEPRRIGSSNGIRRHAWLPCTRMERCIHRASLIAVASSSSTTSTERAERKDDGKKRLAVFVSGGGSNFKAIHHAIRQGEIRGGEVVVVVTNAPSCGGAEYARQHGIPVLVYPPRKSQSSSSSTSESVSTAEELAIDQLKEKFNVNLIILAGYMKLIPGTVVDTFPKAIVNIHPGLLPSFGGKGFYGSRVHEAVIRSGARFSGPTVHFIDEEYDTGPILSQAVVPVYPTDTAETLASRVLKEEHILYPRCIAAICEDRVEWRDDGIPFIWEAL